MLLVLLAGCGGTSSGSSQPASAFAAPSSAPASSSAPAKTTYLSVGTGAVTGTYYPLGGALASVISGSVPGYSCAAEATGGAVENATLLADGNMDLGFLAASTLLDVQSRTNGFEDKNGDNCLALFSFFPEVVQILSADPNIRTVPDLRGKNVAVGAIGSGTEVMCRTILSMYGMTYDDIKADYLGFGDAADGIKDGTVDVAFTWAGVPTASVLELSSMRTISLITFTDEELEELKGISPYVVPITVTKDVYPNMYEEAQTFSIPCAICGTATLPEEFVYDMMTAVFDNLDTFAAAHVRGGDLSLETALDGIESAKLHPGAVRFFREKGMM